VLPYHALHVEKGAVASSEEEAPVAVGPGRQGLSRAGVKPPLD